MLRYLHMYQCFDYVIWAYALHMHGNSIPMYLGGKAGFDRSFLAYFFITDFDINFLIAVPYTTVPTQGAAQFSPSLPSHTRAANHVVPYVEHACVAPSYLCCAARSLSSSCAGVWGSLVTFCVAACTVSTNYVKFSRHIGQ